ncbi:hypothetical protein D3C84_889100 [compost metagenome]
MQAGHHQQRQRAHQIDPDHPPHPEGWPAKAHQVGIDLRHQNEARRIDGEQPAVVLRRHAIQLDENKRRAGDVSEHTGNGKATGHAIGEELPVAEQPPVLPQGAVQGRAGSHV